LSSKTLTLTDPLRDYLVSVAVREDPVLAELRAETATMAEARMQICPEQGAFLDVLARSLGVRQVLEIGTFTGYSSTVLGRALPPGGRITCCDVSDAFTAVARRAWARAGITDRVELRMGPAVDTLAALVAEGRAGTYDLAFVDADKENYAAYLEGCLVLLRPGAVVLFDNVLWGGSVLDPADTRPSTVAIRALNAALRDDARVDLSMIPIGDGLTMCRKRQ
jgi:predicted O-methyltransferase YrrM